jgi:DNA-binding NarL/FixJ family response regulator
VLSRFRPTQATPLSNVEREITLETHPSQPNPVMIVTISGDIDTLLAAITASAAAYMLKGSVPTQLAGLLEQLRSIGSGSGNTLRRPKQRDALPAIANRPADVDDVTLSSREFEVLSLIAKGIAMHEVARLLTISPHTVGTHVKKLYQRLGVHSRGEAVFEARKMRLV